MTNRVYGNFGETELDGSLTSTATSVVVVDAAVLPSAGGTLMYVVTVDDEIMGVTNESGNTLTVTRGAEGTTPATHANGAAVRHTLTRDSIHGSNGDPVANVYADYVYGSEVTLQDNTSGGSIVMQRFDGSSEIGRISFQEDATGWTERYYISGDEDAVYIAQNGGLGGNRGWRIESYGDLIPFDTSAMPGPSIGFDDPYGYVNNLYATYIQTPNYTSLYDGAVEVYLDTVVTTNGPQLFFGRSRSSGYSMLTGDYLGRIAFDGGAAIRAEAAVDWSGGDQRSNIVFSTNTSPYTMVDRWRINGSGNLEPLTTQTYDIGSSSLYVNDVYLRYLQTPNYTSLYDGNVEIYRDSTTATTDPVLSMWRSRSGGWTHNDNDELGTITFYNAAITARVDGTPSTYPPTELLFATGTATVSDTPRWRISPAGDFEPLVDDTYDIGSSSVRPKNIYSRGGIFGYSFDGVGAYLASYYDPGNPAYLELDGDASGAHAMVAVGSDSLHPEIFFRRTRASFSAVVDNDVLGDLAWNPRTTNLFSSPGARIFARVDGTPGSDYAPTEMVFATGTNAAVAAERWRISPAGDLEPMADSSYDIGTDTVRVATVYADTVDATDIEGVAMDVDVQVFTSDDTWTKPTGSYRFCRIMCIGGGGGGGGGRKGAAGTLRYGGGGGGGGGVTVTEFLFSVMASSYDVTVGAGGAGGAGQTTNSTDGNDGNYGQPSYVGASATSSICGAGGGYVGRGGSTVDMDMAGGYSSGGAGTHTGGNGGAGRQFSGQDAGSWRFAADGGTNMSPAQLLAGGAGGGGGGAGITAADVAGTFGGRGGVSGQHGADTGAGGATGGSLVASTGESYTTSGFQWGGGGGGGGAANTSGTNTWSDGAGGGSYGGGGGGGGAQNNSGTAGAGGDGADGIVVIWCY